MEHTGTVQIETERLILKQLELTDADDLYKLVTDKEVYNNLQIPEYTGVDMAVDYISKVLTPNYQKPDFYDWGVYEKASGRLIGRVSNYKQDNELKMADLAWFNIADVRGKGYITEAVKAIIDHLQKVGFVRIEAFADVKNHASIKVMERVGMQYEGTLRKYDQNRFGTLYDAKMYSIIKE